jgi:hypothetical protein
MPALVAGIHVFEPVKAWMAGTSDDEICAQFTPTSGGNSASVLISRLGSPGNRSRR